MARARQAATLRKTPLQKRAAVTVDAILAAAARILTREGYGAFTTNRVAETAGISVGSLYQYFPNKEAILGELMRRHADDLERSVADAADAAAGSATLDVMVRQMIRANIALHAVSPALHRVLSDEVPRLGPADWREGFDARVAQRLKAALAARTDEVRVPDLDLAIYVIARAVEGAVHAAVALRPDDLKNGQLETELTRLVAGYLKGGGRER